jgi:hypothetical protein
MDASGGPCAPSDPRRNGSSSRGDLVRCRADAHNGCRSSPDRLADTEQVALAVSEPSPALAHTLTGVVPLDFGDAVHGLEAGQAVFLEHHATPPERHYGGLDVSYLPSHLGVTARRGSRGLEQGEVAAADTRAVLVVATTLTLGVGLIRSR